MWGILKCSVINLAQIPISPIRPVKSIKFLIPNFGRFSLLDVERLKNDDKWLSDSHVTLALRFVAFFFMWSTRYWISIGIVFKNLWVGIVGLAWKSLFWTPLFGQICLNGRKTTVKNTETGWTCWSMIWRSCRCMSRKSLAFSEKPSGINCFSCIKESLETWNRWEASDVFARELVRNLLA